jgi:hypothetical protein
MLLQSSAVVFAFLFIGDHIFHPGIHECIGKGVSHVQSIRYESAKKSGSFPLLEMNALLTLLPSVPHAQAAT